MSEQISNRIYKNSKSIKVDGSELSINWGVWESCSSLRQVVRFRGEGRDCGRILSRQMWRGLLPWSRPCFGCILFVSVIMLKSAGCLTALLQNCKRLLNRWHFQWAKGVVLFECMICLMMFGLKELTDLRTISNWCFMCWIVSGC